MCPFFAKDVAQVFMMSRRVDRMIRVADEEVVLDRGKIDVRDVDRVEVGQVV